MAITGDLVDGSVENLWEAVAPLAGLRARHGVFFVTGNHEYYSGVDEWMAALGRLNIRVLDNERVAIGPDGGGFDLAGVHDHAARRMPEGPRTDMAKALGGRDPARACVLLAHQPKAIEEAARFGVGLQLSGHTHGGQIWPFSYFVRLAQPYLAGPAPARRHADLRQPGHRVLGAAHAAGHAGGDHPHHAPVGCRRLAATAAANRHHQRGQHQTADHCGGRGRRAHAVAASAAG